MMSAKPKARVISKVLALELLEQRDVPAGFFVSPTGSNSNLGTLQSPFAGIQFAIEAASAGDTINVLPGTYNCGKVTWPDQDTVSLYIDKALTIQGVTTSGQPISSALNTQATIVCQSQGANSKALIGITAANLATHRAAATAAATRLSGRTSSSLILGRKSTVYSLPR